MHKSPYINDYFGDELFQFAESIFTLNRSITGSGNRETLRQVSNQIPELDILSSPSGKVIYDWIIPSEWEVKKALLFNPYGEVVIDFQNNNLHLVGYSISFSGELEFEELNNHLHSLADLPDAIPYVTSYYQDYWGFCLSENDRKQLIPGKYRVEIETEKFTGEMTYGKFHKKGKSRKTIFFSTYICHPSMANNEVSGITIATFLAKYINSLDTYYSYEFAFIPETVGSINYLHSNLRRMKKNVLAGFNLTCIGDERNYSFLPSRMGQSYSDQLARNILNHEVPRYIEYPWLERGSDERQYCSPGVDLPVASIMRSKYGTYPEYHTSLDQLGKVVTAKGLDDSFKLLIKLIVVIEKNILPIVTQLCEPHLSKHQLYPTLSSLDPKPESRNLLNVISYCDGSNDIIDISQKTKLSASTVIEILELLEAKKIIKYASRKKLIKKIKKNNKGS